MKITLFASSILLGFASLASAATFYTPVSIVTTNAVTYGNPAFVITNLYEGPGVGYDAAPPHGIASPGGHTWVTNNPGGAGDYYLSATAPILVIDLGADRFLSEISTWGYSTGNTNGVRDFSLRFATSAEGTGGFGTSIGNQGGFIAAFSDTTRDSHALTPVTARYVEFTALDNWRGFQGATPGGDRVGLGEIAFEVVPEPSSAMLSLLAGALLLRRRRRV